VGFEPEVLAQAALVTGAIAGGAWPPAVAVTVCCTLRGRCSLSERRAGNQRDERERGDKGFHDASPFVRTIVRGSLQQRRADGQCSAVSMEMAPCDHRINHVLGFEGQSNWLAHSYFGLDSGGTALRFCRGRFDNRVSSATFLANRRPEGIQ
jgi:hypothetical protein